jgi:glycine oxidase
MSDTRGTLAVVGAGVIGLSVAWRAQQAGWAVTVIDSHPSRGASWAAAGMLAPITEAHPSEPGLLRIGLESAAMWPEFAADLTRQSGQSCGFRDDGTLVVGYDRDDAEYIRRLAEHLREWNLTAEPWTAAQRQANAPAIAPMVAASLFVRGDHSIDNRSMLGALQAVADRNDVPILRSRVRSVTPASVELVGGDTLECDAVAVCAGIDSIGIVPELPVRPVKGQIIRALTGERTGELITHTIRAHVRGRSVYLVPRRNGEIVIGASVEERGRDTSVTIGPISDLLEDARLIVPGIDECELVETWAGLRPTTPNNMPIVENRDGVVIATGHGRNGFLLSPWTAATVNGLLDEIRPAS